MKFAVFFIVMVCTTMYVCKAQQRSSGCRDLVRKALPTLQRNIVIPQKTRKVVIIHCTYYCFRIGQEPTVTCRDQL